MMLSSRGSEAGRVDAEGAVVAEEGPEDVDAAGEGDDGLGVGMAASAFFEVVGPVGTCPHHAGLRGQIEHMAQRSAVAARFVQVAGSSAGVVGDRHQPGCGRRVAGAGVGRRSPAATSSWAPRIGPKPGIDSIVAA
jgi:hypothetical protein